MPAYDGRPAGSSCQVYPLIPIGRPVIVVPENAVESLLYATFQNPAGTHNEAFRCFRIEEASDLVVGFDYLPESCRLLQEADLRQFVVMKPWMQDGTGKGQDLT